MNSIYTTTITREAQRRGIGIEVIDPVTPVFVLKHKGHQIRCYNALTDRVGAVTFHMAQNKRLANVFLKTNGFPVPVQEPYSDLAAAKVFLKKYKTIVVKPCAQWGGRGVSVAVRTVPDLVRAIAFAGKFEDDIVLEECVSGEDYRLIFVDYRYVAAIRRRAARVTGNGRDSIRKLIQAQNRMERKVDPSHVIPLDAETGRNLIALGLTWATVPKAGREVQVRLTSNYHTGGSVDIVTREVPAELVKLAGQAARKLGVPVIGIDFLVNVKTGQFWLIELSADLAISPPEGDIVVRHFMDYLFPETRDVEGR
jgi:D-alanine-D-alanine ligase-like ATP-grasp enzyme